MAVPQPFEDRQDRALPVIGQRLQRIFAIAEFLVLCADPPGLFGFAPRGQIFRKLVVAFDRSATGLGIDMSARL